jgi:hypothetical protein
MVRPVMPGTASGWELGDEQGQLAKQATGLGLGRGLPGWRRGRDVGAGVGAQQPEHARRLVAELPRSTKCAS